MTSKSQNHTENNKKLRTTTELKKEEEDRKRGSIDGGGGTGWQRFLAKKELVTLPGKRRYSTPTDDFWAERSALTKTRKHIENNKNALKKLRTTTE